jgi:hypothetical protein
MTSIFVLPLKCPISPEPRNPRLNWLLTTALVVFLQPFRPEPARKCLNFNGAVLAAPLHSLR